MTPEQIAGGTAITARTVDRVIETSGHYRVTETDSVQAAKLDGRPSRALLLIYAAMALGLFTLCLSGPLKIRILAACGLLGGLIGEVLTRHVIMPARRRRLYPRLELLHNEFTIEISDRDIRISSARTDVALTADRVTGWKEGKVPILIHSAPRTYFTIPKRLETGPFDMDMLRARLQHSAGKAAR